MPDGGGHGGPGGPGIHGGGFGPHGGSGGGRHGHFSRSGGMFSGAAHVNFGGQGILGHIFGTRATANTGAIYDSLAEKYAKNYEEALLMSQADSHRTPQPSHAQVSGHPQFMRNRTTYLASFYLTYLSVTLISMSVVANVLGAQMWSLFGIIQLDAGVLVYPFVYISLDVINEIFHKKVANRIVFFACLINVICIVAFNITRILPEVPGADNVAVFSALGFSTRVFIASTIAFLSAGRTNNYVYEKLRTRFRIGTRCFFSSVVGRIFDSTVFTIIAFAGRAGFTLLFKQWFYSLLLALVIEALCTLPKKFVATKIKRSLGIED